MSVYASGAVGQLVFDRRGFVRLKGNQAPTKTAAQGDARQAMTAAQHGVKVCGPVTRDMIKGLVEVQRDWSAFLNKKFIGKKRKAFSASMAAFEALEPLAQDDWNNAAEALKMEEVELDYAAAGPISPGAQLFAPARTHYDLDIHAETGSPDASNAAAWQASVAA
jgi:hypothetical protein